MSRQRGSTSNNANNGQAKRKSDLVRSEQAKKPRTEPAQDLYESEDSDGFPDTRQNFSVDEPAVVSEPKQANACVSLDQVDDNDFCSELMVDGSELPYNAPIHPDCRAGVCFIGFQSPTGKTASPRSACVAYFGPGDSRNMQAKFQDIVKKYIKNAPMDSMQVTENRAALGAACLAVISYTLWCHNENKKQARPARLEIVSTSEYVTRNMYFKSIKAWRDRGWISKKGDPIANRDLWELLGKALDMLTKQDCIVDWQHVQDEKSVKELGVANSIAADIAFSNFDQQ